MACEVVEIQVRKHERVALLSCGATAEIPEQQLGEIIRQVYRGRTVALECPDCSDA